MSRWETSLGTPNAQEKKIHTTAASAQTRVEKGFKDLMEFGATYNHVLYDQCAVTLQELRGVNLKTLPLGEWREWSVEDAPSGLRHIARVRRTE